MKKREGGEWCVAAGSESPINALVFASTEPRSTEVMRAAFGRFTDPRYPAEALEACFGTPYVHSRTA